MKFKKVEISAFRIYDKSEDSTFDFTIDEGDIANFVSLYAPNGFGKTSFYDAIEWGITNNIQRFWQNKNTQESIKALRNSTKKQVKLLRHNDSSNETKTFVKITTDSKELTPRILNVHGSRKTDINNETQIENIGFRQVILSQEWISSFLKEVDGERRYQIFMENPDLQEIDNYFNGVKILRGENQKAIVSLESEIDKIRLSIDQEDNDNLLETINLQIIELKEEFSESKLNLIELSTTQEQIKDFKDLVSSRIVTCNQETSINEVLESIKKAKIGGKDSVSIEAFYDSKKLLIKAEKEIESIELDLEKFNNLEKSENQLTNNQKTLKEFAEEKKKIEILYNNYDNYKKVVISLKEKQKVKGILEKELVDINGKFEELTRNEITIGNKYESLVKRITEDEVQKAKLPNIIKEIISLKKEIEKTEEFKTSNKKEIEDKNSEIKALDEIVDELKKIVQKISDGQYSFMQVRNNTDLTKLTKKLEQKQNQLFQLKKKQKELDENIEQQQSLNSSIGEFIKSGLLIANDLQTSSCPLCEYQYNSHKELAERISNNKALSNLIQNLLSNRSTLNQEIIEIAEEIRKGNEKLIEFYQNEIDDLLIRRKNFNQKLNDKIKKLKIAEDNLIKYRGRENKHNIKLKGLTIDEYENQLNSLLKKAFYERDYVGKELSDTKNKLSNLNEQIRNNKAKIELIEKEVQKLLIDKRYILILTWFNDNFSGQDASKFIIKKKEEELLENSKIINDTILELKRIIEVSKKELSSITKQGISKLLIKWIEKSREENRKIEDYIHFLKDKFEIEVEELDKKKLIKFFKEKEKEFKIALEMNKKLREGYQKLEKYCENLSPFLQSENAKLNLTEKEKELNFIKDQVAPLLEKEKEKTKNYLEKKVKDFFYEDLINELYGKIDPHPDFKSVEFIVNFDTNNPRLDIFVKNLNEENSLIPNLYFSTAQINILSLSIFLASALNSEEYNCIFIDDPIQSMDSINVLSTIDVLRSIVVNENKQIILSTHDENFHNLLKKKIPHGLFKSKFLELETFGKIKQENPLE